MEKIKYIKCNTDFEYELQDKSNDSLVASLEHLFLWCSKPNEALISKKKYSDQYLDLIASHIGHRPLITEEHVEQSIINWWGNLTDIADAREKNSNYLFHQWLEKNNPSSVKIVFLEEIPKELDVKFLYKKEFGLSGKSFIKNLSQAEPQMVQMPSLDRVKDYSILFDGSNYTFLEHEIGSKFDWKSVRESSEFFPEMLEIFKKWQDEHKAYRISSLDFFTYKKNNQLFNFPSEINYRKTMGYVFLELIKLFPDRKKLVLLKKNEEASGIALSPIDFSHRLFLI